MPSSWISRQRRSSDKRAGPATDRRAIGAPWAVRRLTIGRPFPHDASLLDEDILRGCRNAFDTVLKAVTTQWEAAKRERPQMFEGAGIWSGGAADAAHNALRERIADLESVKDKLQASVDLFNNCVTEVVDAKNQIIDIVDIAHNLIDKIQNDPQIEDKAAAIQAIVDAARSGNESGDGIVWTTPVSTVTHNRTGRTLEEVEIG